MKLIVTVLFFSFSIVSYSQRGMSMNEFRKLDITTKQLDSLHKSAIHVDSTKAVYKTEEEQKNMMNTYHQMFRDLTNFLQKNNFTWDKNYGTFNRVYFAPDGKVNYFLYNFTGKEESEEPTKEQEAEFSRLLNAFLKEYQFPLQPGEKFVQCGKITYAPTAEE